MFATGRRVKSSERWQCRKAIHCDNLLEQQQQPSRKLGNLLSFNIVQSAGASSKDAKFVSGFVSVCGSCVAFDKYSFDRGARGYFLGPIHVKSHADPLQRGVLCKPQGLVAGTPLYGVVVPAVRRRGCFRFDSAVVAPELAFFLDALPRGIEYVHANRDKLFFPDGRGDLFAAACLLMRDALTLVHECLPRDKRPPSHRPLNLEVPPVHFAALLACFCECGDVFARFSRALVQRSRSADPRHVDMLKIYLPSAGRDVLLTSQCITSFAEAQRTEAEDRRATLLLAGRAAANEDEEGVDEDEGMREVEEEVEEVEEAEDVHESGQRKRSRRVQGDDWGAQGDDWRAQGDDWGAQGDDWGAQGDDWSAQGDDWTVQGHDKNPFDCDAPQAGGSDGAGGTLWCNEVTDVESEGSDLDE